MSISLGSGPTESAAIRCVRCSHVAHPTEACRGQRVSEGDGGHANVASCNCPPTPTPGDVMRNGGGATAIAEVGE